MLFYPPWKGGEYDLTCHIVLNSNRCRSESVLWIHDLKRQQPPSPTVETEVPSVSGSGNRIRNFGMGNLSGFAWNVTTLVDTCNTLMHHSLVHVQPLHRRRLNLLNGSSLPNT